MTEYPTRAATLVAGLEAANREVMQALEGCSEGQWQMLVEEDGRPAGVIFNHIASGYKPVAQWAVGIAQGQGGPAFTMDQINAFNDLHATQSAGSGKAETLALLQEKSAAAAALIKELSDEQLAQTAAVTFLGGRVLSAEQMVEWVIIGHARGHLKAIKEAFGS